MDFAPELIAISKCFRKWREVREYVSSHMKSKLRRGRSRRAFVAAAKPARVRERSALVFDFPLCDSSPVAPLAGAWIETAVAEIALSLALKEDFDAGQLNRPSEYPNRNGKLSVTIQPPRGAPQTWEAYFRGSPRTALIELIETLNLP